MANKPNVIKLSDEYIGQKITRGKRFMFERYFECPICGFEPYPEITDIKHGQKIPSFPQYACPKCNAITLTLAVRIKMKYIKIVDAEHRSGEQAYIEAEERREEASYNKMTLIQSSDKTAQKINNINRIRQTR